MRVHSRSVMVVLALVLAGCGSDIQSKIACSDDTTCIVSMGTLREPDASADSFARCCGGFCMLKAFGCDTGYRFLTRDPSNAPNGGFGECVASAMCPAPPVVDMSLSGDSSTSD